jgi:ADP-ribose pyrophosphatase YjhB (NUDIX family)
MGYIEGLRKQVGNTPLIMVGAAVLWLTPARELFMMRRTDNRCWGIPGGAMEIGESVTVTALREMQEETGLTPAGLTLFDVFSGPELYYRYPNGAEVYNVSVVFRAASAAGDLHIDLREHDAHGFFPLDNLPEAISPPLLPVMRALRVRV